MAPVPSAVSRTRALRRLRWATSTSVLTEGEGLCVRACVCVCVCVVWCMYVCICHSHSLLQTFSFAGMRPILISALLSIALSVKVLLKLNSHDCALVVIVPSCAGMTTRGVAGATCLSETWRHTSPTDTRRSPQQLQLVQQLVLQRAPPQRQL